MSCRRLRPGRRGPPSSQLAEIEENRKQTVPWTFLLDIPANVELKLGGVLACRHWRLMSLGGSTASAQSPDDSDRVETATPLFHEPRRLLLATTHHRRSLAMIITQCMIFRRRGHAFSKTGLTKSLGSGRSGELVRGLGLWRHCAVVGEKRRVHDTWCCCEGLTHVALRYAPEIKERQP